MILVGQARQRPAQGLLRRSYPRMVDVLACARQQKQYLSIVKISGRHTLKGPTVCNAGFLAFACGCHFPITDSMYIIRYGGIRHALALARQRKLRYFTAQMLHYHKLKSDSEDYKLEQVRGFSLPSLSVVLRGSESCRAWVLWVLHGG